MDLTIFIVFSLLIVGVQSSSTPNRPLEVIDTDGGIDDALAMLLVLTSQDKAELLAITCVFGDTDVDNACNNGLRVLALTDREGIPVHKGSSGSIKTGKYIPELVQFIGVDGLGNRSREFPIGDQHLSRTPAALALTQLARTHPGSITLLAIGPLTNLALAHRIDPDFTLLLKEIVIIGANYNGTVTEFAEFNFEEDPLAANIILTEAGCPLIIIPRETTAKNGIPWEKYQELTEIDTRLGHFFRRVSEVEGVREYSMWGGRYRIYDFIAASVALHPEVVTSEVKRALAVEYEGGLTKGLAVVLSDQGGRTPARIVTDVNLTAIFELLRRMLSGST